MISQCWSLYNMWSVLFIHCVASIKTVGVCPWRSQAFRRVQFEKHLLTSSRASSIASSEAVNHTSTEMRSENADLPRRPELENNSICQPLSSISFAPGNSSQTLNVGLMSADQQEVNLITESTLRRSSVSSSVAFDIEFGDDRSSLWSTVESVDYYDDIVMSLSDEVASMWNRLFFMLRKVHQC